VENAEMNDAVHLAKNEESVSAEICEVSQKFLQDSLQTIEASYVYALGRIVPRFPSLGIEKEFAQVIGRTDAKGLTDQQTMHSVLSNKECRYLAKKMCWMMTIEGMETYILKPRGTEELDLLLEAIRPSPSRNDLDVVIGVKGPLAPPKMCNGLLVPIVFFDQIYSFDIDELLKAIPRPEKKAAKEFETSSVELLEKIMQMADNAGATDEQRALNYLSVRYHAIYAKAAEMYEKNFSLTSIDVNLSRLSGTRKVVDVVFSFTNRGTDVVEKYFVRVDVTEEFPFLVTKMSPYYDR
jgi:hypothetical protein